MNRFGLALALAAALFACSPVDDSKAAEQGVTQFHKAMDAGQYSAIYDGSAKDIKATISRGNFVRTLAGIHQSLGAYKSGKTVRWNNSVGTDGHVVNLTRDATFERGSGGEEFVFRIEKDRAVLAGYHVKSPALKANQSAR